MPSRIPYAMSASNPASGGLRRSLSRLAGRRAARLADRKPRAAQRWFRLACRLAPEFSDAHRGLVALLRKADDRLGAAAVAQEAVRRYGGTPETWMLLGECYVAAYRPRDALAAFEEVLVIEERPDAAMAAAEMYAMQGDHATAGARYARAYAAGAGPRALRLNALELQAAGDSGAAAEARMLWERETGKRWGAADER